MKLSSAKARKAALAAALTAIGCWQAGGGIFSGPALAQPAVEGAPIFGQLQFEVYTARKKGNHQAEADALYNLAKAYFEAKDLKQAEQFMRESLQVETGLKRPASAIQTHIALAGILTTVHRTDDALTEYQKALDLASSNQLNDQTASILSSMGTLALVSGHYDDASKLFQQAREKAAHEQNAGIEGSALINLAVIAKARNQKDAALKLLTQAVAVVKDCGDDRVYGAALLELGRTQSDLGKQVEAIESYKQAVELQKSQFDDLSAAKSLLAMGQIYRMLDKYQEASKALTEADALIKNDKDQPLYIDILIAMGGARAGLGDFAGAEKLHAKALDLTKKSGDHAKERTVLSEIGYDHLLSGKPEQALNNYITAYHLLSEQEPENYSQKGILLSDIGMSYKAVGQLSAAIANYQQSVESFTKANDMPGKASALNSLAVAYLDNNKLEDFNSNYKQAMDLFTMLSDKRGEAILNYNLGQYQLVQGHPADAVPLFEGALEKAKSGGDEHLTGQILRGLGLSYLFLGRSGKALESYKQAETLAESSGSLESKWDCALGLGKCHKALGQLPEALPYLRKAAELVETERAQLSRDSFKTYNLDLRQDCFIELVDALVKSHEAAEALVVAEKGRARAFLDLLEGRKTRRPNDGTSDSRSPAPRIDISMVKPGEAGTRGVEIMPRVTTYVESTTISPINAKPPSLDEIRSLVKKSGSTFVEYFALPDRVLIWVVHPNGEIEMPPPIAMTRRKLTEKVTEAYKAIIAHPSTPADMKLINEVRQTKLSELHDLLLDHVLPYLPKAPDAVITIVPHGSLFSVPFAALLDKRGRFFVEDHTLSYIPAIGVLRATQKLSEESTTSKDQLLAFGNPITKQIAFLGTLPYSEKEVRHVAELFGPEHSEVRIGGDATKANFLKLSPQSSVIHLATHGLVNEERPMDSAVVLAPQGVDDGLFTVKDILQLPPLKARLVVLSACQTARGKVTGDGVVGLSRSFIIAGTPSILVSQWNVDDVITEYQMVAFYKSFLAGADKAKALREAQLKTIALLEKLTPEGTAAGGTAVGPSTDRGKAGSTTAPSTAPAAAIRANPRYWAAFELIGEEK